MFHRDDILRDPVDRSLCFHQTASARAKKKINERAAEKAKRFTVVPVSKSTKKTKENVHQVAAAIKKRIMSRDRGGLKSKGRSSRPKAKASKSTKDISPNPLEF